MASKKKETPTAEEFKAGFFLPEGELADFLAKEAEGKEIKAHYARGGDEPKVDDLPSLKAGESAATGEDIFAGESQIRRFFEGKEVIFKPHEEYSKLGPEATVLDRLKARGVERPGNFDPAADARKAGIAGALQVDGEVVKLDEGE